MKPVKLDDAAADELAAAYSWYEGQVRGLGDELLAVLDEEFLRIQRSPRSYGLVPRVARKLNVHRALVRRFPFSVVFIELTEEIRVLAIAHQSRRPGYWRKRVRKPAAH